MNKTMYETMIAAAEKNRLVCVWRSVDKSGLPLVCTWIRIEKVHATVSTGKFATSEEDGLRLCA